MTPFHDYLHKLQSDDLTLKQFLADPANAADAHGLTKAERSVLRRVLVGASTNSTNRYGIVRPLEAYRQGVRMVQNMMHLNIGAMHAATSGNSHALYLYYSPDPSQPGTNPYAHSQVYTGNGATIGELMKDIAASSASGPTRLIYDTVDGKTGPIVLSFTINGAVYQLKPGQSGIDHLPFWFYTVNGKAGDPAAQFGADHESFDGYALPSNAVVYWQAIAPGPDYGFEACVKSDTTHTAGLA